MQDFQALTDYSSDLEQMKLIPGKVWTQQIENLDATMWRHIHVISLLSTNTSPEPEIHAIQQVVHEPWRQVVPVDVMEKPDVVDVYNGGMNGVKN